MFPLELGRKCSDEKIKHHCLREFNKTLPSISLIWSPVLGSNLLIPLIAF